ncbi:hypothetical protein NC652_017193 [Populus alba x Populus x berolinensis]|nr:hypothetical protein NC652_017193 [Populus alba x Populus x berolinensis]
MASGLCIQKATADSLKTPNPPKFLRLLQWMSVESRQFAFGILCIRYSFPINESFFTGQWSVNPFERR